MIINHNISALNTHRQLGANNNAVSKSLEKLSSGLQINRAGDDAAGLAISEKMRAQIKGLDMAAKNAQDGISLIQTAEGALTETHAILQRMRELAVQSASDTNQDEDRVELQKEVDQLAAALKDISENTQFNKKDLLTGEFSTKDITFHVGANSNQNLAVNINDMSAEALGVVGKELSTQTFNTDYTVTNARGEDVNIVFKPALTGNNEEVEGSHSFDSETNTLTITLAQEAGTDSPATAGDVTGTKADVLAAINSVEGLTAKFANDSVVGTEAATATDGTIAVSQETNIDDPTKGINISNQESADKAITTIQTAIDNVSAERSKLGAVQNRLEHTINNLGASSENLTAAESRIRDVDMAKEMMNFTKNNILTQAAQAMLAQANQTPQGVLQLLR